MRLSSCDFSLGDLACYFFGRSLDLLPAGWWVCFGSWYWAGMVCGMENQKIASGIVLEAWALIEPCIKRL
jgi:hypothetical protein